MFQQNKGLNFNPLPNDKICSSPNGKLVTSIFYFLFFPKCFQKAFSTNVFKTWDCVVKDILKNQKNISQCHGGDHIYKKNHREVRISKHESFQAF